MHKTNQLFYVGVSQEFYKIFLDPNSKSQSPYLNLQESISRHQITIPKVQIPDFSLQNNLCNPFWNLELEIWNLGL